VGALRAGIDDGEAMETQARYTLIGLFTLAVIAAAFGFVYWLNAGGGMGERTVYRVRFETPVSGLVAGSAVLFNGIRVGEVTDLRLDRDDPRRVTATIAVAPATPVHADTVVGLEFQGLMGGSGVIALTGGSATSPVLSATASEPPLLVADPAASQSMTQQARDTLRRLDAILTENAGPLRNTIGNLDTFSSALARNSEKLDGIIAGVERMTGAAPAKPPPPAFDLTAPRAFPAIGKEPQGQLAVGEPTALLVYDTQKILVQSDGGTAPAPGEGQWSDNVPKLFQAKIVQTFENAKHQVIASRGMDTVSAERQLMIDIRSFRIAADPTPTAEVEFAARMMADGKVLDTKVFHATAPAKAIDAPAAARALDAAFGKAATELVLWAAGVT
jgi:phospholipid/cholesterol/gamma-HCH transport system substrate-binding protein